MLYNITCRLSSQRRTVDRPTIQHRFTKLNSQLEERRYHFATVLNKDPPVDPPELQVNHQLPINTGNIMKEENKWALTRLKKRNAVGSGNIPPEVLKAGGQTSIDILYDLFNTIWKTEEIPEDCLDQLLVKLPKKGDTSYCKNWRGITLLSIPSKVLSRLEEQMKT